MNNALHFPQPLLQTDGLWKSYADGDVHALRGVSLTIFEGDYVALMGPSGSGKSTLLNMLGGLDVPSKGTLQFRDQPYPNGKALDAFRAQSLGFIFQSFCLIPTLTALENVQTPMLGIVANRRERVARAEELLDTVGLGHRMHHLPVKLSVGERQRVAIARALANEPPLILADEPTGNLDSQRTEEILALFEVLRRSRAITLVVVTHSELVASRADRVLYVNDGQLMEVEQQRLLPVLRRPTAIAG
jgi:ABC-type lipoprotein export system ATPase subunit